MGDHDPDGGEDVGGDEAEDDEPPACGLQVS